MISKEDFKEEVRQRADIVEVITGYGVQLNRAGASLKACCPFHNEKTPSFTVTPDRQRYHCFGCGQNGDVFKFVMEREGVEFPEAVKLLAQRVGLPIPEWRPEGGGAPKPGESKADLYELHKQITAWFRANLLKPEGRHALDYVRQRGLTDALLDRFGIGYAPDGWRNARAWGLAHGYDLETLLRGGVLTRKDEEAPPDTAYDRFRDRLMFPIWDPQGRIVAFSGRVLQKDAHGGKYVNSPETPIFRKSNVLYGLHLARTGIRDRDCAVLCEGQLDVIACHGAGVTNAVAPQGTAFTEEQARLLSRYTKKLVLAFDGDKAGIEAAMKSAELFIPAGLTARVAALDAGDDPDSIVRREGAEALQQRIDAAGDFIQFLTRTHLANADGSPAGKGAAVDRTLAVVAKIPNAITRSEYAEMVAVESGSERAAVFQRLKALLRAARAQSRPGRGQRSDAQPVPPPPREISVAAKAEITLLELALHYPGYANRMLDDELPDACISTELSGSILREALAQLAQGEEPGLIIDMLLESLPDSPPQELVRALLTPEFLESGKDKRVLDKAYADCVRQLRTQNLAARIDHESQQLNTAASPEARKAALARLQALSDERRQLARL